MRGNSFSHDFRTNGCNCATSHTSAALYSLGAMGCKYKPNSRFFNRLTTEIGTPARLRAKRSGGAAVALAEAERSALRISTAVHYEFFRRRGVLDGRRDV